jgi:hypothetical protein
LRTSNRLDTRNPFATTALVPFGWSYAKLEAPESYTLRLEWLRTKGSARLPWRRLADGTLYRLGSHLCGSRFDGNGGMVQSE